MTWPIEEIARRGRLDFQGIPYCHGCGKVEAELPEDDNDSWLVLGLYESQGMSFEDGVATGAVLGPEYAFCSHECLAKYARECADLGP